MLEADEVDIDYFTPVARLIVYIKNFIDILFLLYLSNMNICHVFQHILSKNIWQ